MSDGTTILLGLPGVEVREVQHRLGPGARRRSECGSVPGLQGVLRAGTPTAPHPAPRARLRRRGVAVGWHKRQCRCVEEACPRKAFTEMQRRVVGGRPGDRRLRGPAAEG
jgi:hypothetical protein